MPTNKPEVVLPKPKFGEWLRGIYASERNPHRDGMYVRTIIREGRFNPGKYYELTDGEGDFWTYLAESTERISPADTLTRPADGVTAGDAVFAFAGLLTSLPHVVPFGAAAWATPGADLAAAFNAANGLTVSRDFPQGLVFPKIEGELLERIRRASAPDARAESPSCEQVDAGGCAPPVVASTPRDEWRPIETAPKGTMILLADMTAKEARHWAFVGWKHNWNTAGHVETPSALNRRATHWKPLPPPPEAPHGDGR